MRRAVITAILASSILLAIEARHPRVEDVDLHNAYAEWLPGEGDGNPWSDSEDLSQGQKGNADAAAPNPKPVGEDAAGDAAPINASNGAIEAHAKVIGLPRIKPGFRIENGVVVHQPQQPLDIDLEEYHDDESMPASDELSEESKENENEFEAEEVYGSEAETQSGRKQRSRRANPDNGLNDFGEGRDLQKMAVAAPMLAQNSMPDKKRKPAKQLAAEKWRPCEGADSSDAAPRCNSNTFIGATTTEDCGCSNSDEFTTVFDDFFTTTSSGFFTTEFTTTQVLTTINSCDNGACETESTRTLTSTYVTTVTTQSTFTITVLPTTTFSSATTRSTSSGTVTVLPTSSFPISSVSTATNTASTITVGPQGNVNFFICLFGCTQIIINGSSTVAVLPTISFPSTTTTPSSLITCTGAMTTTVTAVPTEECFTIVICGPQVRGSGAFQQAIENLGFTNGDSSKMYVKESHGVGGWHGGSIAPSDPEEAAIDPQEPLMIEANAADSAADDFAFVEERSIPPPTKEISINKGKAGLEKNNAHGRIRAQNRIMSDEEDEFDRGAKRMGQASSDAPSAVRVSAGLLAAMLALTVFI